MFCFEHQPGSCCSGGGDREAEVSRVKRVVADYFRLRYESRVTLEAPDFSSVCAPHGSDVQSFLSRELPKIRFELDHWRTNDLRFLAYEFDLEYKEVTLDANRAVVDLVESHAVRFSVSPDTVSSMANLKHTITLRKINGNWFIVDDFYNDMLHRALRESNMTVEQYRAWLQTTPAVPEPSEGSLGGAVEPYSGTWYPYDRSSAVSYANTWAESRNPDYYNFDPLGGDCTNYASQVLHAGDCVMDDSGSYQWYYYGIDDRAPAWTGVNELYTYLVNNWYTGPQADSTSVGSMQLGDIIQLDLKTEPGYEHSLVVVSVGSPPANSNIKINCHTEDRKDYPLTNFTWRAIRYLHITGWMD